MSPAPEPLTFTPEQAAEIIGGGMKPSWLKDKAARRLIPSAKVGGSLAFTRAHLEEIVRMGERRAEPAQAGGGTRSRRAATEPVPETQQDRPVIVLRPKVPRRMRQQAS
ncbi:MAG TPA: hypothetical protein VKU77_32100 [Streptosporangiaceae bacterium]|nr:hypothetical protein [Streptosporangiaceae bacterium]